MRGAEGIADEYIAERGQGFGESRIILFFFAVEAQVFKQSDIAVFKGADDSFSLWADAVFGKGNRFAEKFAEMIDQRFERIFGNRSAFGRRGGS